MKKVITLIFCLLIAFNVAADDWPHQNISQAVFALDIKDRTPINIIEELDNSLGKIYFLQISVTSKVTVLRIAGYTITKSWQMLCLMLAVQGGGFGLQKIFGLLGSENGKLKCLVRIVKCFIKKNLTT